VKLSLDHRLRYQVRYASISTSKRPNRPHISSFPKHFKERRHHQDNKITANTQSLGVPATVHPDNPEPFRRIAATSSSVRRCLGPIEKTRKRKNDEM
jgi:hypothetical protein